LGGFRHVVGRVKCQENAIEANRKNGNFSKTPDIGSSESFRAQP
jgi:hypothetical protein